MEFISTNNMKKRITKKVNANKPTVYTFTGDRKELVAKLLELRKAGKLKIADIARATDVKSSSAACWLMTPPRALPTAPRIEALVTLINSVK